jgi:hypothetical protein
LELLPKVFVSGTVGYFILKRILAKPKQEVEETGPIKIDKNVLKVI